MRIELHSGEQDLLHEILEDAYYSDRYAAELKPLIKQMMEKVDGG